ncbi:MAG TPA: helix-turn-helix domain-containing protein [Solirubrobacterales bacterium]|nr:helix-turn-helix domain-containing protein [Solirubrobacterales bacterium]
MTAAKALGHPTRVRILMSMNAPTRTLSPKVFSEESGESLGNSSYHFRQLEKAGCVEVVETIARRGATEHHYAPVKRAMAWTSEWEALGPVVRQNLTASLLGGAVHRIGNAIDAGTFDARNESHMSWDTAWIDEEGWQELHKVFQHALEEALLITTEAEKRVAGLPPSEKFLATYLISTFESPPEDEVTE